MLKRSNKLLQHVAISLLITVLILLCIMLATSGKRESKVKSIVTILKSEPMQFLVCRKIISTVAMEKEEKSTIWGNRNGLLLAEVTVFYGFDLSRLTDKSIKISGEKTIVNLGEPSILTISIDTGSMRFFTKMSGLQYFKDKVEGNSLEKEMLKEFSVASKRYFHDRKLLPSREEMLKELQQQLKLMNLNIELK